MKWYQKQCSKCREVKYVTDFVLYKSSLGISPACRDCDLKQAHEYYLKHKEERREYSRQYSKSKIGKQFRARQAVLYRQRHPDKYVTRGKTMYLIKTGVIKRKPCEVCGSARAESHHVDYNDPINLRWFCRRHHMIIEGILKYD